MRPLLVLVPITRIEHMSEVSYWHPLLTLLYDMPTKLVPLIRKQ